MKYKQQIEQGRVRRFEILETGLMLWPDVTAAGIARKLGIKHSSVLYHFSNLKDAIAAYALKVNDKRVISMMILVNHPFITLKPNNFRTTFKISFPNKPSVTNG